MCSTPAHEVQIKRGTEGPAENKFKIPPSKQLKGLPWQSRGLKISPSSAGGTVLSLAGGKVPRALQPKTETETVFGTNAIKTLKHIRPKKGKPKAT